MVFRNHGRLGCPVYLVVQEGEEVGAVAVHGSMRVFLDAISAKVVEVDGERYETANSGKNWQHVKDQRKVMTAAELRSMAKGKALPPFRRLGAS